MLCREMKRFLQPVSRAVRTSSSSRRVALPHGVASACAQRTAICTGRRSFATIGGEGSDSDFAPKKKEPAPSGRDVQAEIKEMVTNRKTVLFMKGSPDAPMCGFSNRAVQILDHHKAVYGAFNVLADAEIREGIKKYSNWPTIPQLYVGGDFVGGCDIMMEMHENGELKQLLDQHGSLRK